MELDAAVAAIRGGDAAALEQLLAADPELATARVGPRTLLHIATDWPGGLPRVADTIRVLAAAGAELDAPFGGPSHDETPLHWAASADDLAAIDALLDAGADLDARGGIIGGGTPLNDATAFGQWQAARRLLERGARTSWFDAAALGLTTSSTARCGRRRTAVSGRPRSCCSSAGPIPAGSAGTSSRRSTSRGAARPTTGWRCSASAGPDC